jgi:murein DD-endopeptidase MepM/ murein hydrolase activator NlpD
MKSSIRILSTVFLCPSLLLVFLGFPAQGNDFWSPRDVVLDTYTEPIPFLCNGELLLAYELHITNMDRLPISLASVEVLADGGTVPTEEYSGEHLAGSLTRITVAGQSDDVSEVMGGQRAILHVLLRYTGRGELPSVLTHRVRYLFLKTDGSQVGATVRGGAIRVAKEGEALIIGAPLGEGIWLAARGVASGLSGHRRGAIRPQNGIPYQKARYAIDFAGFDDSGQAYGGSRTSNESWFGYGADVFAVADAQVVSVRDGIPDIEPFDPDRLKSLTGETLGGNAIVLDLGNDLFAFYGHLQPGSIVVREGDQVRKGQVLARLGSSGNSDAPHLHFQINWAIPLRGEAVPYAFESYEYLGEQRGCAWLHNPAELIEKTLSASLGDRQPRAVTLAIADSIKASMVRRMREASLGGAVDWTRAAREGGELRTQEMPGAEAVLRFRGDPPRS